MDTRMKIGTLLSGLMLVVGLFVLGLALGANIEAVAVSSSADETKFTDSLVGLDGATPSGLMMPSLPHSRQVQRRFRHSTSKQNSTCSDCVGRRASRLPILLPRGSIRQAQHLVTILWRRTSHARAGRRRRLRRR